MKVWVVLGNFAYSHGEVCGVFSTLDKAQEAARNCRDGRSSEFFDFEVLEFEMDNVTIV